MDSKMSPNPSAALTGISRRRMVFRPPAGMNQPVSTFKSPNAVALSTSFMNLNSLSSADAQAVHTLANMELVASAHEKDNEETTRKRAAKSWEHEDVMAYYEGLKMYGKDFDSVVKVMAKRKVPKDKEQAKNYFFNSLKILKQLKVFREEELGDVSRDAKELFLTINACEWRKRTGNSKYVSERMRELVFDGSTTLRLNKKTIVIKTPPCPSLVKFFTQSRRVEKFPSEVTVVLKPKTYGDATFVISRQQNPLIKVRISTNDRVARLFELLQKKWGGDEKRCPAKIRLWPSECTEIGSLAVAETDISPSVALCLNKLKKEVETIRTNTESAETSKKNQKYTVVYSSPFVLTDKVIEDGLTFESVKEAIAAELYCACGMTDKFELRYSVEFLAKRDQRVEPWQILTELLSRDYGESLLTKREDGEMNAVTRKRERATDDSESNDGVEPISKMRTKANKVQAATSQLSQNEPATVATSESVQIPTVIESAIVQQENNDFEDQLQALTEKRRTRTNFAPKKKAAVRNLSSKAARKELPKEMTVEDTKSTTGGYVRQFHARRAALILAKKKEEEKNKSEQLQVDFSAMTSEAAVPPSSVAAFLNSLRTPENSPEKRRLRSSTLASKDESRAAVMERLFGADLSMSPSFRRTHDEETSTRIDAFEHIFGEISMSPFKMTGSESQNGLLGFPMDVQQGVAEMMSQDSQDFVRSFEPLIKSMETPPKKRK